jgi:hypothetical protein
MRLIDADALEEGKFHGTENWTPIECASWQWGWNDAIDAIISNAPTVDPVKHGHWEVVDGTEPRRYGCSVCKRLSWTEDNYCSYCGAKMDKGDENDEID